MHKFKNNSGYYNETLPMSEYGTIDRVSMVGMTLSGEYRGVKFNCIEVINYISSKNNARFTIKYKQREREINCSQLTDGWIGAVLGIFKDLNNKHIDDNDVVHIFITNSKGKVFEALYSGNHVEEVMNSNWCVAIIRGSVTCVQTNNYNKTGETPKLHQVDLGSSVRHINGNPLDNRIENLELKIKPTKNNKVSTRTRKTIINHDIIDCGDYYKLIKGKKEMLFDCDLDFIKNKYIYCSNTYWTCVFVENGYEFKGIFHKELFGLRDGEYKEYNIHIDHLNRNPNDNRFDNIVIATAYSNQCNKGGNGYRKIYSGSYITYYMSEYRFWELVKGVKEPSFKTEREAINEVNRRRSIIDNARVKLKSKQELDELIQYCLDNKYILENGLADLDLGYLYWKGMIENK